ncbi:hypothetical protein D9758_007556 [Tetrapyrgos nigripes]|uniref:Cytochrome P450 n=1 Tax=Tetrapyrgos nigripes TaxID=182062 RepID=A0A8H5G886_9AGAR|nr:hypothetical protein D9758_007556 [Tetrapyrgos nigripes]
MIDYFFPNGFPPTMWSSALAFVGLVLGILCLRYISGDNYPYPPGPKGFWYIGLPSSKVPSKKFWLTYIEWGKKYGDLIHFSRFGKHYVVINSLQAARDILDKQARVTSDRPHARVDELYSSSLLDALVLTAAIPYSDKWRKARKLFHQNLRAEATVQFHPIQSQKIRSFVEGLVLSEEALKNQISTLSQKIMFLSIYGLDISNNKEDMPARTRETVESVDDRIIPGLDGYKYIPFFHLLPSWFPGGRHIAAVHAVGEIISEAANNPWDAVQQQIKSDGHHASLIAKLLSETDPDDKEEMDRIKYFGFQSIAAAADTTMSAISTFFLAMSLYPDVQSKGQEELDAILGKGRMPTFDDRPSLPYIEAIFREVMRWHPALPMGLCHDSIQDIAYNGYYIPKGTSIYVNIWAITHDPSVYKDPDQFIPERHLHKDGNINSILAYGFGRRVCVGRYMANDTIWLTIAATLAAVKISSLPNENVEDYYSDGGFCSPNTLPFMTRKVESAPPTFTPLSPLPTAYSTPSASASASTSAQPLSRIPYPLSPIPIA